MGNPVSDFVDDHVVNTEGDHVVDGTFVLYDVVKTAEALKNHDWASLALIGVTGAIDTAATVSDPFGSLIAAGLGWVMDHLQPLKGWLDDLTGDAGAVEGLSSSWEQVAASIGSSVADLRTRVHTDLAHMEGDAIEAYTRFIEKVSEMTESVEKGAEGMAGALRFAATITEAVHGLVRDVIAQICGSLISYAGELVLSAGLATPLVIEQAETRVASVAGRIGTTIKELISSCRELERLVNELDWSVGKVREVLDHIHPDAARGRHSTPWLHDHPDGPRGGGGRHAADHPEGLGPRLGEIGSIEVPLDAIGESYAAGSNAAAHHEGPAEPVGEGEHPH